MMACNRLLAFAELCRNWFQTVRSSQRDRFGVGIHADEMNGAFGEWVEIGKLSRHGHTSAFAVLTEDWDKKSFFQSEIGGSRHDLGGPWPSLSGAGGLRPLEWA